MLFWCSFPSVVATLVGSLIFEGLTPYRRMAALDREAALGLGFAIGISCVNAAALNLANLFVTRHLGAVGAQIVAQARLGVGCRRQIPQSPQVTRHTKGGQLGTTPYTG